ncbi:hypothetical protein BO94DRAFT_620492 [Aspergillus sclerotioniger CBS 115572]|uniref:HNH nuclease domain-containing protein n=1 Tax=Aspergillus sclerotioniger CBS 115572 TaxID=1450535 RepID=A0A317X8P8_9EURO|nr:hypothetical protein BO94DRAFT_620492 [Aspergillus sclerotioniger CBS 115572]PWY94993.1 hypothetical protein BO94DRAFT_620492 [Aspergillus sclerotioniger CBS 115572]
MGPPKRKQSSNLPLRRSARLKARRTCEPDDLQPKGPSTEVSNNVLTAAKDRIARYTDQRRPHEDSLKPGLAAFLAWLPDGGREAIAEDIVNAITDDQLYAVFSTLLTAILIPMKTRPQVGSFPSVEAVAETRDQLTEDQICMEHDGYCCVVTGDLNTDTWKKRGHPDNVYFGPVEVAHIIPLSYASWHYSVEPPHQTSTAWEVLWRCFPRIRQAGMTVESINSPIYGGH